MAYATGYIAGLGQVRLTLELTPQSTPTGGDILAVAILTTERNPMPLEGQLVTFWLGRDEAASEPTDAHGRATHTFTSLGFGTHAVSVQVAGVYVTQRHPFAKAVERPKVPTSLSVTFVGPRGRQELLIHLNAEDGSPVSGFSGTIRDGDTAEVFKTDATGSATYPTHFTEASRAFGVRAGNQPGLVWRGRLLGPKPTPATPTP